MELGAMGRKHQAILRACYKRQINWSQEHEDRIVREIMADCRSGERNGRPIADLLDVLVSNPPYGARTTVERTLALLIDDYVHLEPAIDYSP
jgi:23S rRNA G2445 N2-methylase RlmL